MTPATVVLSAAGGRLGTWSGALAGSQGLNALRGSLNAHQCVTAAGRARPARLLVAAKLRRRLLSYVLSAPQRAERYFDSSPIRKYLWAGISVCTGFYAANIVSLSFGALAVNDVFAAVITLMFCEVVTHLYYTAEQPSLRLWFANLFKMGLIASLLADAAKLGS